MDKSASHLSLKSLRFVVYSSDDVRRLSVTKVVTPLLFDSLGHAIPGGLYDPVMGPYSSRSDPCATCGQRERCPGHSGHIELCTLLYNPVLIKTIYNVLRFACLSCFNLQVPEHWAQVLKLQLKLIDRGFVVEAQDLELLKSQEVDTTDESSHRAKLIEKYTQLLAEEKDASSKVYNTKNIESLRTAIVNTTLKAFGKNCLHCKEQMKSIKYSYKRLVMTVSKNDMQTFYEAQSTDEANRSKIKSTNKAILADECREFMRQLYQVNEELLPLLLPVLRFGSTNLESPVDVFFTDVVPVTPCTSRPANKLNDQVIEHPQTTVLKHILNANSSLRAIITTMKQLDDTSTGVDIDVNLLAGYKGIYEQAQGDSPYEKMYNAWQELQTMVDQTWDKNMGTEKVGIGLKQTIEKKAGIIRMHMMGKRVNYACRTVITPDPYINVDEIGIPDKFARKLSYPVPVTPWNLTELRQMVRNGPEVHPGANYVQDENGQMQIIPADNATKRESMAKLLLNTDKQGAKTVHRHLQNGDVLLLNRQPSLHRPSIMAHKARILRGEKTFRLHYSNCKSYNADFDGDEMNAHCPQSELARSEGYNLVNVSNQYLVPKDGTPLGGLIQDQVIAGVKISTRGRFFNREDYQHLVFAGLNQMRGDIKLLPPAIIKPTRLWSGKQIFSTIVMNLTPKGVDAINLNSTAKINDKNWCVQEPRVPLAGGTPLKEREMSEAQVIFRGGELCVGVMDKTHYGATPYGLIHSMFELYGGTCATQLLTSLGKVFTIFLQREGFTLGVHDILVLKDADKKRSKIINKSRKIGDSAAAAALGIPEDTPSDEIAEKIQEAYTRDPNFRTILDRQYKSSLDSYTNSINKTCLPAGLLCKFPDNNLQLMVGSGAKGSTVNTMQISCLLGQIELEGKRPPLMISGKSLPSFSTSETSPKSGGFIDGRFLTGIQPQDFFFHCMAGREGLIDTAVKTSRSGYLQRCLIKHLEGLNVNYDMTVRDSDNSVIQFMYGEDGMDIAKAPFFKQNLLPFLDDNAATIVNAKLLKELRNDDETNDSMLAHKKRIRHFNKKAAAAASEGRQRRGSAFQKFSSEIGSELIVKNAEKRSKKTNRRNIDQELTNIWQAADADKKAEYSKKCPTCPDPVFSTFKPDNHFGSISEYFEKLIDVYVKKRPDRKHEFTNMMCVKSMRAFAAPGEPVGLLAAQSIGEPSTQMTLNTFHFAGRGEMNVTLGIPRLREILMMASANIKTPSMDIPFKQQPRLEEKAENLRLKLVKVTVHDVLESINVYSSIQLRPQRAKVIKLRFNFLPRDCYKEDFGVKPKRILKHMERTFFKQMFQALSRSAKSKNSLIDIDSNPKEKGAADNDDEDIDEREPTKTKASNTNDSSDDEAVNDEDDATAVRLKNRNDDENEYDEPEVAEEINDAGVASDEEDEGIELKADEESDDDDKNDVNQSDVLKENTLATNYVCDKVKHQWCELTFNLSMQNKNLDLSTVLKEVARKSIISQVPMIKRAITYVKDDKIILKTDGINIVEMFKHNELLDLNRLYTNHVHAMAQTYGIEAAARVIVKEVQNVFKVYGITVDPRHLLLIADYMTFDGTFKPLSRRGMESSASPLQQMSFESSLKFLQEATIAGRNENLESPSSRLMVGQPCKSGTGAFSLLNPTIVE